MSIDTRAGSTSRSDKKTRGISKAIKDLKDLSVLRSRTCYKHSGPMDLREQETFFPSANTGEGQALALR